MLLALPTIAIVFGAYISLRSTLGLPEAGSVRLRDATLDGFSVQFAIAIFAHAITFGSVVVASVAQYVSPIGLFGEPAPARNDEASLDLMGLWLLGGIVAGIAPWVSVAVCVNNLVPTTKYFCTAIRFPIIALVCTIASMGSVYVIYIAQLIQKGPDLLERRDVSTTCR
jgi:hypothetical protein